MPLRLEDELRDNFKYHVNEILELVQNDTFFYYGEIEHSEKKAPFLQQTISYDELAYYPYQLTYYIEKNRKAVFAYSMKRSTKAFYLSEKNNFDVISGKKEILYEFNLGKREFDFVLFKFI